MLHSYNINRFLETRVFLFFIIFFCLAFQALSYFSSWTDTELYPTHSSQYLFSPYMEEFLFALKPLFYSLLKISFTVSSFLDLLPMTTARFLFAFNGLAILALMYFYIKQKTNRYNALLAVLFLAGMNIFLDRGFRVRSDLLSTSLSLGCLLINLNIKKQKDWRFYLIIPLLSLILITSLKGIYWLCFTSILIWYDIKIKPNTKLAIKITSLTCFSLYFLSFIFKDPFFIKTIYESAKFYIFNLSEIYHFALKYNWLTSVDKLSHISLFISRNLFLVLIIIIKFLFIIYSLFISKNRKKDLSDLYFLILLLVAFFHPQQKLFFLSALSPFFCIAFFTDEKWKDVVNQYSRNFKSFLLIGAFIYTFSYSSYFSYRVYTKKNNLYQKNLIKNLNDFFKDTNLSINIFDPNCIIYTRKTKCEYILYNKRIENISAYLKKKNFDIILSSFTVEPVSLLSYKDLNFEYVNIKNHIYYKAFIIDEANNVIETEKALQGENNLLRKEDLNENNSLTENLISSHNFSQKKSKVKQEFLSGKKILKKFDIEKKITVPNKNRTYFYIHIDRLNRALKPIKTCLDQASDTLKEACYYNEEDFKKSFIALTDKKIAVFYIPFPFHIESEKSLRVLLRYDKF